jgi:hypothetical protein
LPTVSTLAGKPVWKVVPSSQAYECEVPFEKMTPTDCGAALAEETERPTPPIMRNATASSDSRNLLETVLDLTVTAEAASGGCFFADLLSTLMTFPFVTVAFAVPRSRPSRSWPGQNWQPRSVPPFSGDRPSHGILSHMMRADSGGDRSPGIAR